MMPRPASVAPQSSVSNAPQSGSTGDRSRISGDLRPVYNTLESALQQARAICPPQSKRMADDVEKRLNVLFDSMNNGTIAASLIPGLISFAKAIEMRDWGTAIRVQQELALANFDAWMIGMKRLVDLLAKN
jgi:protein transport protein SEC31